MNIKLVSTYTHPVAIGLRYVSAYLKAAGHDVQVLFMTSRRDTAKADFSDDALADFLERLRDCDLIGMSLMTNTFHRARILTERIRVADIKTPIIWGGTHPTVAPQECLEIADAVCVGEGEEAALELAATLEAGRDPTAIANLGFRGGGPFGSGRDRLNPVRPLDTNLDDIPFPDYEMETHWVAGKEGLEPARPDNLRGTLERFRIETTRGCPFHCTFCNNAAWQEVYRGKGKWVRMRSNDNVLAEIRQALACFPVIRSINIVDDLFFVRRPEQIDDFVEQYLRDVNLPLQLDAFPNTITEEKVRSLARVPIELVSMGIESASADTLKNIYKRPTALDRVAESIEIFRRHRVPTEYHYLVSNPYEPDANVIESMRFIATHHKGRCVRRVFPLMLYPGTPLYDRACADGLIEDRHNVAYDHTYTGSLHFAGDDYLGMWLRIVFGLRTSGVPGWLVHRLIGFATHGWVRRVIDRPWFGKAVYGAYFVGRKIARNFIYQPFIKPFTYLRRKPRPPAAHSGQPARWTVPRLGRLAGKYRGAADSPAPTAAIART